jgi:hypothetical protein
MSPKKDLRCKQMTLSDFIRQPYRDNQVMPQFVVDLFQCLTGLQIETLFKKKSSSDLMGKVLQHRLSKYDLKFTQSKAEQIQFET